jgi:signal transduction histidine kinase
MSYTLLALTADILSDQLQAQLERLAELIRPRATALERHFLQKLCRFHFDPKQRKSLMEITAGAAAKTLGTRRSPSDFFEQVEYNGRRLAKLNLPPGSIVEALRIYDGLLSPLLHRLPATEQANLKWALEQLHFCIVLTLNNAFYQVREAETEAYHELFRSELESRSLDQLLSGMLEALFKFCRAQAAAVFLLDPDTNLWRLRAAIIEGARADTSLPQISNTAGRFVKLSKAQCVTREAQKFPLDPRWRNRYRSWWSVPMTVRGRVGGVMQFGFATAYEWLPRELAMLSAAAERCLIAAEKARLVEQLAAREEQVRRLAEHMLQVEEGERKRISRELHDEAGQSLLCIRLQLEMLERLLPEACGECRAGLVEARGLTERTIIEIRRLIGALSPSVLEQLGLPAALRQLAGRLRRMHRMRVRFHAGAMGDLPPRLAAIAYRLIQECTNNIGKHSFATRVNIFVDSTDGGLRLRVEDNGVGFNVEEALRKRDSFGLAGMRERAALFGGKFQVESRLKRGTKILIELPTQGK